MAPGSFSSPGFFVIQRAVNQLKQPGKMRPDRVRNQNANVCGPVGRHIETNLIFS